MSLDLIRQGVVTAVEARAALFTAYPLVIEYDNRILVDTRAQENPFLQVRILLLGGEQVDLSNDPLHRITGQIHLAAATKNGAGTRQASELVEFFYPYLHKKSLGGVRTLMSSFSRTIEHLGWDYTPVIIPFWYDKTYGV